MRRSILQGHQLENNASLAASFNTDNLNQLPVGQVRVAFTAAGGTPDGTCDIWVSGNSVGA